MHVVLNHFIVPNASIFSKLCFWCRSLSRSSNTTTSQSVGLGALGDFSRNGLFIRWPFETGNDIQFPQKYTHLQGKSRFFRPEN